MRIKKKNSPVSANNIDSIRKNYEKFGVDNYYKNNAGTYSNPHIDIVRSLVTENLDLRGLKILDLCCGTGEITNILCGCNENIKNIKGLDPYTFKVYTERTSKYCYPFSFKDIATGKLTESFDAVICSFGLHLCEKSLLPAVLWQLSRISETLIIITPNKNPDCGKSEWVLLDEKIKDRVRLRIYQLDIKIY